MFYDSDAYCRVIERLFRMGAIIAVINKKDENAAETAVAMLKMLKHKDVEAFGVASPTTVKIEKSVEALQNQNIKSPVVIGHALSGIFKSDKPQPIRLDDAMLVFEGRIYPTRIEISDAELAAEKIQQPHEEALKNLISESEGCFAFAVAEPEKIIAGRDVMGLHPFYYGENMNFAALASECKALWKIGIKTVNSFPPGHIALADKNGFKFKLVKTLVSPREKQITMQTAAKELQTLLQHSVRERVLGLKEVAVAFSGGLDSSLIAFLAKNSGANVHLFYVSLENQPETEYAKRAAEELKLPIHVYLYAEEDVGKALPRILWLIEEPDSVKTSIGIPFYWTAEKASEMNLKVMLAGQGADELFGGYKRYINDYLSYGKEKVLETMFSDIGRMYETNFERDYKICNFHGVELRLPFAQYQMAKFAAELPLELKIEMKDYGLRKLVLRQVAENLGLPQFIVKKPKRAMQYATGVNKALKKLSKREKLPMKEYLQKTFQTAFDKMGAYA
jgi:asparagine synthase (glutamine-hydrolysing)